MPVKEFDFHAQLGLGWAKAELDLLGCLLIGHPKHESGPPSQEARVPCDAELFEHVKVRDDPGNVTAIKVKCTIYTKLLIMHHWVGTTYLVRYTKCHSEDQGR